MHTLIGWWPLRCVPQLASLKDLMWPPPSTMFISENRHYCGHFIFFKHSFSDSTLKTHHPKCTPHCGHVAILHAYSGNHECSECAWKISRKWLSHKASFYWRYSHVQYVKWDDEFLEWDCTLPCKRSIADFAVINSKWWPIIYYN